MNVSDFTTKTVDGGLTQPEVEASRRLHGSNILTPPRGVSLWKLYLDKYRDPMIKILLLTAFVSLVLAFIEGDFIETIGIFVAIFLATTVGFVFERDAARKFSVLTSLDEEQPVKVKRDGRVQEIARRDVVVGDILIIEVGDEIPADGQLLSAVDLQINESSLTGEPMVTKYADAAGQHTEGAYPADQVLRSTMVMGGRGVARVTAVGDETEIGKVARKSTETTGTETPLNQQLGKLARFISKLGSCVAVVAFVLFLGHSILTDTVWHSGDYLRMTELTLNYFMMAVTLIVMAVPEGLPMAVTLSLALNMRRMLRSNNLVRKLHACETMGAVTVICTDKTGTLTQNRMEVREMVPLSDDDRLLATAIAVNTTAHLDADDGRGIGNPTEIALLTWAQKHSFDYHKLRERADIEVQLPFSTERKLMATIARVEGRRYLFVKGAPEIILAICRLSPDERPLLAQRLTAFQQAANRTLALAYRELQDTETDIASLLAPLSQGKDTGDEAAELSDALLTLQSLVAISDPLRLDVPSAVAECRRAGITVKIVTGDTSATAIEIARQIGIWTADDDKVEAAHPNSRHITGTDFAALSDEAAYAEVEGVKVMSRARPDNKQRLVQLLQRHGEIVAVTGDGTNDAPALNYAHVGLSLGSGTSVAKEASDMTLLDDSFASIARAVMWGRSLYKNIQRFLYFQLVVNLAALLLVLCASLVGMAMPLTVTQILWVNLIMDTFAAMSLASLPPSHEVMNEKPRRSSNFIITRAIGRSICISSVALFILMSGLLLYYEYDSDPGIQLHELTIFFTVFVMLQFWNLFNAKSLGSYHSAFRHFFLDRGLILVLLIILGGQWIIVTFGGKMFRTEPLSAVEWLLIIASTSVVLWAGELWRWSKRRGNKVVREQIISDKE